MNIFRRSATAIVMTAVAGAALGQFAYVPNERTGTLSIIDLSKDEVIGAIPAGQKPRGLVASLDRKSVRHSY